MCNCLQQIDQKLLEHNTRIEIPWFGPQLPFVGTIKVNEKKRGKPARIFANYCPFCGDKYPEKTVDQGLRVPSQERQP